MSLLFQEWPSQNSPHIQKQVVSILKKQGVEPAYTETVGKSNRCDFMCKPGEEFTRTLPQEVIQALVTPQSRYNLLAKHDVGTGKSCVGLSVAYNFASNGYNVLWVSRKGLAHESILKRPECFDGPQMTTSAEDKRKALGENQTVLWGNPKMEIQVLSYINLGNLFKKKKSSADQERLKALGMEEPDIFRDCLLIIDEPHLMYTEGSLGAEGRKMTWEKLPEAIEHSYRVSGDHSVTVLLLTATPLTNRLDDAAKLINLLIRDPKRKLPLGKELETLLVNTPDQVGDLMRGYISYNDGSNDVSRFAQLNKQFVNLKGIQNATATPNINSQSVAEAPTPTTTTKNRKTKEILTDGGYHEQLQLDCAQGSLEKRTTNEAKQKLLNCYFERGDFVGAPYLDRKWRDYNLVTPNSGNVSDTLMKKRIRFINMCRQRAPKAVALYEKIMELDATDNKKKHFIFSGSQKMTSSIGVLASLFAAFGHKKLMFSDAGDSLTFTTSPGNKDAYVVVGKSPTLYGDNVRFTSSTLVRHQEQLFKYFNQRPDNIEGQNVRFIILGYTFKEGVDLKDIGYIHLLEKQKTAAEETQALGRALRMCGNCGIAFKKNVGWKIQAFTYDVQADRVPLVAKEYEGMSSKKLKEELTDTGSSREEFIAKYYDGIGKVDKEEEEEEVEQEKAYLGTYGDYVRKAATDAKKELTFERFDEQMRKSAIDFGFYDLFDPKKIRIALATSSQLDVPDLVPVTDVFESFKNVLQKTFGEQLSIISDTLITANKYDYIIQSWCPSPNYLSSKTKIGMVPSFRALQLFSSKCQYYLWLKSKGFPVLPYTCVKKLTAKKIATIMRGGEKIKSASPTKLKNVLDRSFGRVKFVEPRYRSSQEELQVLDSSDAAEAERILRPANERYLMAKPASNDIFVAPQKIGEFDTPEELSTYFSDLFARKEQVVLQPFIPNAKQLSVWLVGHNLMDMQTVMTTNDSEYYKRPSDAGEISVEKLCKTIMYEMQKEVGPLWCAKIELLFTFEWYVDKITLRMDMHDWPKDKPLTDDMKQMYVTSLNRLLKPKKNK